jgi:hypothetical protein
MRALGTTRLSLIALALASGSLLTGQEARHAIMHPTQEMMDAHRIERSLLPLAKNDPHIEYNLAQARSANVTATLNLLSYFAYTPATWNQQQCGDCWVWGSTAACSMDMAIRGGARDLLSVQYMNSNYNNGTGSNWACCGGYPSAFASFYQSHKMFVPNSNTGASFADASGACPGSTARSASSIVTNPNHPITSISDNVIAINGGQASAIANIKAQLNANHPVPFCYFMTSAGWNAFDSFWSNSPASAIFPIDSYHGGSNGGGHCVCCVGFDDSDSTWIMLNSWGTTSTRPDGTFKIPQALTYTASTTDGAPAYEFDTYVIAWPTSSNTVAAKIVTPASDLTLNSGTTQTFTGSATDSNSSATLSYSWNFGDGYQATTASATHTYTNTGSTAVTYTVTFTATDNTGVSSQATRKVTVNPASTPTNTVTASITTPSGNVTVASGATQSFVGSATDSNASATLSYAWAFGDGATAATASASHAYTNTGSSAVTYTATLTATDNTGAKGTASRVITVSPSTNPNTQLILNGGFESGATSWTGTTADIGNWSSYNEPAATGSNACWLCGQGATNTETIYQKFTIPSTNTKTTLSFSLHIDTAETAATVYDYLNVQVLTSTGAVSKTLATYSNVNAAPGYSTQTFDLSAYKGQTIYIYFKGTEDANLQTSFLIDNVSVLSSK